MKNVQPSHPLAAIYLTLALALTGCDMTATQPERTGAGATRARSANDFAGRRLENVDLAVVQPVAERVFRSYFRLDPNASSATDLVAVPADVATREPAAAGAEVAAEAPGGPRPKDTIGDYLGIAPRRYRRVAELRLTPSEDGVLTQVSVRFQRLTTTERTAFARERGDDRPTETPIDHMGPTSPTPREEWQDDGRRDRYMEQKILNDIQADLPTTNPAP
jgi:hypothetical protein